MIFITYLAISLTCALPVEAAKIKVEIGFFGIDYSIKSKKCTIRPGMFSGTLGYETKLPWEVKQVAATVYHVRLPLEKDVFLKMDAGTRQVFIVSGGTFGKEGGSEKLIVGETFFEYPPPARPDIENLHIVLPNPALIFDTDTNDVAIAAQGLKLMGPEEIELVKAVEDIYHVRARGRRDHSTIIISTFKIVNTAMKTVSSGDGRFGESSASVFRIMNLKVIVENEKSVAPEQAVHKDLGMAELRNNIIPESAWVKAEQDQYRTFFDKQKFDVLIVPFQVQDYAFDHIERSLMTNYLVQQINSTPKLRVADPDIVERALGWGYRTFSEQRTYELANAVGVRKIVRIFV